MKKLLKKLSALVICSVLVLFILGCAKTETKETKDEVVAPVKELPDTEKTSEAMNDVTDIEEDISDEDLDALDKDLENMNW